MTLVALVVGLALGVGLTVVFLGRRERRERADDGSTSSKSRDRGRLNRTEEERLVRSLNAVPIGIVVFENEQAVFANRFARQFDSGRHTDALVGQAIEELVHRATSQGATEDEIDLYGPPPRHLSLRALPLEQGDGTPLGEGILVVIEDTSERNLVEALRRDFVANVSHELKTPVGAMGVLAETLIDEHDPSVIERLSQRLHHEAIRLGTTIDDLLTLSTIEAGDTLELDRVDVAGVIERSLDHVMAAAELRQIEISTEIDDGLIVEGDRRQLESAISNLLDNAIKYSDEGAEVELVATAVGHNVEVSVTDSGDGIPERDLERIFERFYRVDQARSRNTGGTGLGLSIVRHVAINHGGTVTVRSREGVGTSFTLRIATSPSVAAELTGKRPNGEEVANVR